MSDYILSRKKAAEALEVSTRTVDRYVKSGKLSSRHVDGRVYLSESEVYSFYKEENRGIGDSKDQEVVHTVDSGLSSDLSLDKPREKVDICLDNLSTPVDIGNGKNVLEDLVDELKSDLKEKQERLEIANYRVGQLETQLRNTVPLLEYHKENFLRQEYEKELKNELDQSKNIIRKISIDLKYQALSKKIFIIILVIIILLQPLWILAFN